jgi:hypothetical protein
VTRYIEGFSHFVTSMTAPTTSGWSICPVGFAPTGKRRLFTAHTLWGRYEGSTMAAGPAALVTASASANINSCSAIPAYASDKHRSHILKVVVLLDAWTRNLASGDGRATTFPFYGVWLLHERAGPGRCHTVLKSVAIWNLGNNRTHGQALLMAEV